MAPKLILGYINKIVVNNFNPFLKQTHSAKLLLSLVNKNICKSTYGMNVVVNQVGRSCKEKPTIEVTYKDGKKSVFLTDEYAIDALVDRIDSHSRHLKTQDMIS
ncbi:ribosomal protein subunit l44 [Schizosaccharomyces japonicus yFS275]|uniref:Large ribosomal subunit protein mL53 n=1 Tax=Schizosaccharomyces japonicus (strain yFS275 / FY16936) TaxID=402676 RepID=T0TB11_SCHJY|nr:ribosomal protein subunit l44 [Schizosaccharomyces japonicus yFS275]EQC53008.1 ribosomal protein subunit l44 [Schizosaccharomyces japonicus yFS275]